MKTKIFFTGICFLLLMVSSCSDLTGSGGNGSLLITFEASEIPATRSGQDDFCSGQALPFSTVAATRSSAMPDTDDFIISVTGPDGEPIYRGRYADSPEILEVPAGSYTVSALSADFDEPGYDCPQFGDTQVVVVKVGQSVAVNLKCMQLNCGIRLNIDRSFSGMFPYGTLYLRGADGTLLYDYSERRTAFFTPGSISLLLSDSGESQTLFTRTLSAQQMLSINVSAAVSGTATGITVQVDTTRTWLSEDYCFGGGGYGQDDAYSVPEARNHPGETGVWVYGYVVGCFNSSGANPSTEQPFKKGTNIALAARSSVTDKNSCLSIELPSGPIRDALNLMDNPSNLGKAVFLKGDIVQAYYGIPGLKNLTEYDWK